MLTTTCRVLYGTTLNDSQPGMWVFKCEVLDHVTLTDDGMPLSEEMKTRGLRPSGRARG